MDREALNDYPLGLYDVTAEIVTFEPDRQSPGPRIASWTSARWTAARWSPSRRGTLVTSYPDWPAARQAWKDAAIFPVIPARCGPHPGSWPALSPPASPPRVLNPVTAAVPGYRPRATSTE